MVTKSTVELDKVEYTSLLNRLKFFQSISREISARKPIQNLLDEIIDASKKLLDAEAASLLIYNKAENILNFHTISGGNSESLKTKGVKIGEGIAGYVAENKNSLLINDCYNDERFNKAFDTQSGFKTRNMVCVPMLNRDELIGVIQVINKNDEGEFTGEDVQLFEALAAQCAVAIENAHNIELELKAEQIKNEMETAYKIQQRFLPQKLPAIEGIEMSITLQSAREIGGDYFNVITIDETRTLIFVADVSGKSVSAALIVSTLYSFLQFYFIVQKETFDEVEMVRSFNRFLISSTTPDKYATAWFGIYDSSNSILTSINAGHNPPYLIKDSNDKIIKLTEGGLILGSIDFPYASETIALSSGDTIVFYTDGIPEAMNEIEEEFGEEKFEKLLLENKKSDVNSLTKIIFDKIESFRQNAEQSDDITLGIIKKK